MTDITPKKYTSSLEWVIDQIDTFLAAHPEINAARFGHLVLKDTGLVSRLKAGGDITTRKLDTIRRFFGDPDFQRKTLSGEKV